MKNYKAEYEHLVRLNKVLENRIPETLAGLTKLQRHHSMNGDLPAKTKELVALGIAVTSQCEGSAITHLYDALKIGASRAEIEEVLTVAVMMGGSPALIMAGITLEALDQYEAENSPAHLFGPSDAVDSWGWS